MATLIAMVLGTLTAAALNRDRFFGKDAFTTMLIHAHRLAGHRDRHCPAGGLQNVGGQPRFLDHRSGPRHVLRGHRAQQRGGPLAPPAQTACGRPPWTWARIRSPRCATSSCRSWVPPFWPVASWPLRYRWTNSSSLPSPPVPTRPYRSGLWVSLGRPREAAITNVVALAIMVITMPLILLAWRLTRDGDASPNSPLNTCTPVISVSTSPFGAPDMAATRFHNPTPDQWPTALPARGASEAVLNPSALASSSAKCARPAPTNCAWPWMPPARHFPPGPPSRHA